MIIGRRTYPVKQVGEVITKQDRRDFSAGEVTRAMSRLGFTCRTLPASPPVQALAPVALTPVALASAALGSTAGI